MSNKISVRYGEKATPMSEVMPTDTLVRFTVKGEDEQAIATFSFDFDDLPEENQQRVSLYGLNKLLTDRTSDEKDKLVKLDKMEAVFDMLTSGEWAKERTVGAIVVSPEVEALAQMQHISVPDVQAALAQYDKETRRAILDRADVQSIAKLIREARKDSAVKTLDDMIPAKAE